MQKSSNSPTKNTPKKFNKYHASEFSDQVLEENESSSSSSSTTTTSSSSATTTEKSQPTIFINENSFEMPLKLYTLLLNAFNSNEDIAYYKNHIGNLNGVQLMLLLDYACENHSEFGAKLVQTLYDPLSSQQSLYEILSNAYDSSKDISKYTNGLLNLNHQQKAMILEEAFTKNSELAIELEKIFYSSVSRESGLFDTLLMHYNSKGNIYSFRHFLKNLDYQPKVELFDAALIKNPKLAGELEIIFF